MRNTIEYICTTIQQFTTRDTARSRLVVASIALFLLSACAGQQTRLSTESRRALVPDAQIHAVHHKSMQTFGYESTGYTVAGVLFTPLLAIAQVAEGSALETALRLEDPVLRVKDRLVSALQTKFELANVVVVPASPKNDGIDTLTRSFATGLVLDVRTMKWGVDNARAKYSARARLIRLADRAILWNATCEFTADKTKPGPKMEELKANDGMLLKAKILDAADGCSDQLVNWLDGRVA